MMGLRIPLPLVGEGRERGSLWVELVCNHKTQVTLSS